MNVFFFGLHERIKNELSTHDYPRKQLENLANQIDLRLTERRKEWRALASAYPRPVSCHAHFAPVWVPDLAQIPDPELMQLGCAHLSKVERNQRYQLNLCFHCG